MSAEKRGKLRKGERRQKGSGNKRGSREMRTGDGKWEKWKPWDRDPVGTGRR